MTSVEALDLGANLEGYDIVWIGLFIGKNDHIFE